MYVYVQYVSSYLFNINNSKYIYIHIYVDDSTRENGFNRKGIDLAWI